MDDFFRWLEATDVSVWTRESTSVFAFPAILSVHAIGMALAAGISGVLALRVLGVARDVPVGSFNSFVPALWAGFAMNTVSGMLLLVAYPTKALTNPVFFVKLACIAVAMWSYGVTTRRLSSTVNSPRRWLAIVTLAAWVGAIFAGRLLAYTHRRVLVDF